jgi:hypothetical protein
MKTLTVLITLFSLAFAVSCGGDKKSSSSDAFSNAYKVQTVNALYSPTNPQQILVGDKWYQIQPQGQAAQQMYSLYQTTSQALAQGSQYVTTSRKIGTSYFTFFRVRVVGMIGTGYPMQQYPTTTVQQPVQQVASSGMVSVQSISLY